MANPNLVTGTTYFEPLRQVSRTRYWWRCFALLLCAILFAFAPIENAQAQVTSPASINAGNPIGPDNLGGSTSNTQNFASLGGLGLNQGLTFTFSGQPTGAGLWNGGFEFLTADILEFQADNSPTPASGTDYEMNWTGDAYGLQFTMSGLDNADQTLVTFWNNNVQVPVTVSTYVNGAVTSAAAGNIMTFVGTNIDITPSGGGFLADGDGNNDTGGITIHGAQEGFTIALPLTVAVDEVRLSQTGKNVSNNGNVTLIVTDFAWATPDVALTKSSSFSQGGNGESNVNDVVTYTYVVENTGNVPLSDVVLSETGFTGSGTTPVPTFTSGTGGATPADLPQGETLTYTATYPVTPSDLLSGSIDNQGTITAMPDGSVTDLSDSANPGDGGVTGSPDEDDPTVTVFPAPIVFNPSIEAMKTSDTSGFSNPGQPTDTISYTITVENTGDVPLSGISLTDTLTNNDGTILSPSIPAFVSSSAGSPAGSLIAGETATYSLSYSITQADIDSGGLANTVRADANAFTGGTVFDVSDDGDDGDGNTVNDPTVDPIITAPSLTVTKTASQDTNVPAGVTVTYTYRVTNNGNQTISQISLSDAHSGTGTPTLTPANELILPADDNAPTGDSTDGGQNGIWEILAPGDTVTFTAQYTVTQQDVDTLQ